MKFRRETVGDAPAVRLLVTAAFDQPAEADLVEALHRSGDVAVALVAEDESGIVGHILFSKLQAPGDALAMAPVSVMPTRQGQGIGAKLIKRGLAEAKDAGFTAVFVLGDPAYYTRFNFRHDLAAPYETAYPKEYFMALELVSGALADGSGEVVYGDPFLDLE